MGTNFYLSDPACSGCGHVERIRHIGKRSAGWRFLLHVEIESDVPVGLDGWEAEFRRPGFRIFDEYGGDYTPEAMLAIIKEWGVPDGKRVPVDDLHCHENEHDCATGEFS